MMKALFAVLLLVPAASWAKPKPEDYTIAVHVQASHLINECRGSSSLIRCSFKLHLDVVIDGKKFDLNSKDDLELVLRRGDYKAKVVGTDSPQSSVDSNLEYEFLFPDGTTRKYRVVGETE